ncbi:hypothetical protein [Sphingomonas paucimobilis]|uniref:hypothetical protein n=1 Tax=Sphingomonas paucimobilis TaxID=13689 RepID=UPI0030F84491
MRRLLLLIAAACPAVALAQNYPPTGAPGSLVPLTGSSFTNGAGKTLGVTPATPLPVAEKQESVLLASGNVAVPAGTLYGGNYILNQTCSGYGTVALRYQAADGVTMVSLLTKSVADTSGTVLQFGSSAVVDVLLTGTTGCNVTLSRIP